MCDVGIPANEKDMQGESLYSGDIVQLWHGNYLGTEGEEWLPSSGLTVIIGRQYESYTDGTVKLLTKTPDLFTMGIADCGIKGSEWDVILIKSHRDIVKGERFKSFGINYK